jgi:hypothetical protein
VLDVSCWRICFAAEPRKEKKMRTTTRMAATTAGSFACWSEAA